MSKFLTFLVIQIGIFMIFNVISIRCDESASAVKTGEADSASSEESDPTTERPKIKPIRKFKRSDTDCTHLLYDSNGLEDFKKCSDEFKRKFKDSGNTSLKEQMNEIMGDMKTLSNNNGSFSTTTKLNVTSRDFMAMRKLRMAMTKILSSTADDSGLCYLTQCMLQNKGVVDGNGQPLEDIILNKLQTKFAPMNATKDDIKPIITLCVGKFKMDKAAAPSSGDTSNQEQSNCRATQKFGICLSSHSHKLCRKLQLQQKS